MLVNDRSGNWPARTAVRIHGRSGLQSEGDRWVTPVGWEHLRAAASSKQSQPRLPSLASPLAARLQNRRTGWVTRGVAIVVLLRKPRRAYEVQAGTTGK